MAIDLSKIEDANLREELRAQIKADKQQAIQDRLARVKTDEELETKLAKLKEFEDAAQAQKEKADAEAKALEADEFLSKNNLSNLDAFKKLKAHDEFLQLDSEEDKTAFLKELKTSNPTLFKNKKSVLDLSNADLKISKQETEYIVY